MKDYRSNYKGIRVRMCTKCKKPIDEKSFYDYCPDCFKKVEDSFKEIEDYLKKYPGATAFEIENETEVPYHVIQNFVREGRLIEIPNEYLNVECAGCGCLLLSAHHKYCPECRNKLKKEMNIAKADLKSKVSDKNAKMHISKMIRRGK